MSKTFKSAGNPKAAISVVPSADGVRTVHVHGIEASGVTVPREDAPALALAILEAAGVEPGLHEDADFGSQEQIEYLTYGLKKHVEAQERITAEAEAQAKLEAEALELLHVAQEHNNFPLSESWGDFRDGGTKLLYVNMARRARELNKEDTNA